MNRNRKQKRNQQKFYAAALSTALLCSSVPFTVFAEEDIPKEEVVYVNLKPDGTVKEINVVNSFEMKEDGEIVDYGNYQSLRNMTTTDAIDYEGDCVKVSTTAGKLYYEGKLADNVMPWDISVRYELDGKEISADELAGKSGSLRVVLSVGKNKQCPGSFFDDFGLQASMTLDTEKCSNIRADSATLANVGSNKQVTWTVLPGTEEELVLTADVHDFEMDGIAVNGVTLNLDVEVDDEELMDQVQELLDAIKQLDDGAGELGGGVEELQSSVQGELQSGASELDAGAGELRSGAGTLQDGGEQVRDGAASLKSGAGTLDAGIQSLNEGMAQVQAGLDALNEKSGELTGGSAQMKEALTALQSALGGVSASADEVEALVTASAQIRGGIDSAASGADTLQGSISYETLQSLMQQNGLDIGALQTQNTQAIDSLNGILGQVDGWSALLDQVKDPVLKQLVTSIMNDGVATINQLITLLNANNAALGGIESGTQSYLAGVQQGAADLSGGLAALQESYGQFDAGITSLADTLTGLMEQMSQLKDAVNLLVEEYTKLDDGLQTYTDGVSQVVDGYDKAAAGADALADGSKALKKGSSELYQGTEDLLNGIVAFYNATGTLKDGTGALNEGVVQLLDGIAQLYDGAGELKDGTGELRSETDGMDQEIEDQIQEMLDNISGADREVVSFTSEKNKNVEEVQFVIKTEGITVPEEEPEPETETETESLKEKLKDLF